MQHPDPRLHRRSHKLLASPRVGSKNHAAASSRMGTAAVEAALIMPFLIVLTFGAVDIAQYINLSQSVANASREGALVASEFETDSTYDIQAAVIDYLEDCFPRLSQDALAEAVQVDVRNASNSPIAADGLTDVPSGDEIRVSVGFDFSVIRWLKGPDYWNGNMKISESVCRRE